MTRLYLKLEGQLKSARRLKSSMTSLLVFVLATFSAALFTPVVRMVSRRFGILDHPGGDRKLHAVSTPLLGGLAPYLAFCLVALGLLFFVPTLITNEVPTKKVFGLMLGGLILMIGGFLDDKYNIKPARQIVFPVLATLVVIASGIGIHEITNPFGGTLKFAFWQTHLFTFIWLMGMMYTTKFLDGLDGLVTGLTVIGAGMIFFLTMTLQWYQPEVGLLGAVGAGAFLGFLFWNFHPAKIFLGEGGSLFAGYLLGVLAIISGGKIATTLLVVGIPLLDAAWVILRRIFWEKKPPTLADRKHLHFRLLGAGLAHRQAVLVLYLFAALFGMLTLVLQSKEKLVALGVLTVLMIVGATLVVMASRRKAVDKLRPGL